MEHQQRRNDPLALVTWILRTGSPAALDGMGLGLIGGILREHEPVFDQTTTRSALELVRRAYAAVEVLRCLGNEGPLGDVARARDDALAVLKAADAALIAALAYVMGAGVITSEEIHAACNRTQKIAARWGKDVLPPTRPNPTESERGTAVAPSMTGTRRAGGRRAGVPSSKGRSRAIDRRGGVIK